MNKERQLTRQANRLIAVVLLVIAIIIFFALKSPAQYRVVIEVGNNTPIVRKVPTDKQLEEIVKLYFPKSIINTGEFMKKSVYYEIHRTGFGLCVMRQRVDEKGKYRNLRRKARKEFEK